MSVTAASTGSGNSVVKRVLMVVPYANWAGTERHVLTLGSELTALGWEVTVLAPPGPAQEWWQGAGLTVIEFAPQAAGFRRMASSLRQQAAAWVSAAGSKYRAGSGDAGVIHVHGAPELLFLLRGLRRRAAYVFSSHGFVGHNVGWDYWWAAQASRCWADQVIAVSQEEAARLIRRGLPAARVEVIRNGIPIPADPLGDNSLAGAGDGRNASDRAGARAVSQVEACHQGADAVSLGFVGRLSPQKGLEHLLKALPLALDQLEHGCVTAGRSKPPVSTAAAAATAVAGEASVDHTHLHHLRLWVVGDGPERETMTQMARKVTATRAGLAVEFVGAVADVSPWWRCFDIFALPSLDESFGLVVGEAMAAGVPVIASRLPAVEEFVVDGQTGLLVPAGDAVALASALVRLITDGELRHRLAEQARQYAQEHLSAARMAARTERVYRRLLSS